MPGGVVGGVPGGVAADVAPGSSAKVLRVGGNIKQPMKIADVKPIYPPEARAAGVQGVVILELRIATDGTVADARVLRSIPLLDEAALQAARQWRFAPTAVNDEPVEVMMTVTINFRSE